MKIKDFKKIEIEDILFSMDCNDERIQQYLKDKKVYDAIMVLIDSERSMVDDILIKNENYRKNGIFKNIFMYMCFVAMNIDLKVCSFMCKLNGRYDRDWGYAYIIFSNERRIFKRSVRCYFR